jgi:tetratricopeptide (TPR) repeat protein
MNFRVLRLAALAALVVFLTVLAVAQKQGGGGPNFGAASDKQPVATKGTALMLTVHDESRMTFGAQAFVQVTNRADQSVKSQFTQDKAMATFTDLPAGVYDITVSALGYLTVHTEFTSGGATTVQQMQVVLRKDPSAIDLGAVKTKEVPVKARRDMLKGLAALKSSKLDEAQKRLDAAYREDPSNPDVAFLLGYVYFEKKDSQQSAKYLNEAVKSAPHNGQALTLLGRVAIQREDFAAAQHPLEQAVQVDPQSWMAHYLLATVYLQQKNYDKAKDQAQLALERGDQSANAAQLVLGQAWANLKRYPEALAALGAFIQGAPSDPNVPEVRKLIAEVEHLNSQVGTNANADQAMSSVIVTEPMVASVPNQLLVKEWGPRSIDDSKPQVNADVACPADKVIEQAGERVKELVDDLAKFDAIEDVYHEDVDQMGIPKKSVSMRFDYVAAISEPNPGRFLVDEFRSGRSGTEDFPDQIATRGLPTLAFIFHPDMRDNFDMTCEGLATWNEKATWLVHFQQREDKPHRIEDYVVNGRVYPVSMKGRAWISADTYQVVRLESELVNPIPEIQLVSQHQTVEYSPVRFPKSKTELWLPKNAEIYFDFRKHRYFRRHSFDHFMLFSVDMEEKRKEPKEAKVPESRTPKGKVHKTHA